ncbi:hypothetical protein Purlil1_13914 [Purpureocillium lilacinum]|uniref:RING-type domain-containing protein n=1 Tax=Purpureocillium lilacinum TaxID=33203 RepID=A0ABR0BD38_PURLI|nr:hypothetical protein Purlil1_13914 [Purpureocillium lilacinum]
MRGDGAGFRTDAPHERTLHFAEARLELWDSALLQAGRGLTCHVPFWDTWLGNAGLADVRPRVVRDLTVLSGGSPARNVERGQLLQNPEPSRARDAVPYHEVVDDCCSHTGRVWRYGLSDGQVRIGTPYAKAAGNAPSRAGPCAEVPWFSAVKGRDADERWWIESGSLPAHLHPLMAPLNTPHDTPGRTVDPYSAAYRGRGDEKPKAEWGTIFSDSPSLTIYEEDPAYGLGARYRSMAERPKQPCLAELSVGAVANGGAPMAFVALEIILPAVFNAKAPYTLWLQIVTTSTRRASADSCQTPAVASVKGGIQLAISLPLHSTKGPHPATMQLDLQPQRSRNAPRMNVTIPMRASIASLILEGKALEPTRVLEALSFIVRAERDWYQIHPEGRKGYDRPLLSEAARRQLVKLLGGQLVLIEELPDELDEDCQSCASSLTQGYAVSLRCGHWFHAECITSSLEKDAQCPVAKCQWSWKTKQRTVRSRLRAIVGPDERMASVEWAAQ